MHEQSRRLVYESGEWEVDLARRELRTRGDSIPLGGRAFQIFAVLVQSAGRLVTKDELMARVWPGRIVEENTLEVHISAVRKALGTDRGTLKTSFGRGYRLVGDWTMRKEGAPADPVVLDPTRIPVQPFLTNVPAAASEAIGRTVAVQQLQDLLSAYRAITLTGPGGIGKTTLALEVTRSLLPTFNGDCWLVDVASLSDPSLVPTTVAAVLGLRLGGDEISSESVAHAIGGKKLLLVLNNCEHVIDAAARLAETVLRLCPATSIVATSREVLRIEGEHVYRVPPLDVPSEHQVDSDIVLGHSAVQLFIARARALDSGFSPHAENLPAIAAICRRLDGIPLAIEFAAARAAAVGLSQVASRLDDRFALLTGGRRTALPRHQTLRATLDWSYDLLPGPEQCLLRRLAVFAAGFTLGAAIAVMRDTSMAALAVVEGIANLVAKSLLTLDGSAPSGRWRLLETVRAYALEKLAESGETEQAARRHAEFFRDLVALTAPVMALRPIADGVASYVRELDNVRVALEWTFSPSGDTAIGIVLTAAYVPVWLHLSLVVECRERAERALDSLETELDLSAPLRMQLHIALGTALLHSTGVEEKAGMVLAKALEVAESLDDVDSQLRALWALWSYRYNSGDHRATQSLAEQFSRLARRKGDPADILVGDRLMGITMHYTGNQTRARHYLERMLKLYTAPSDQRHTLWFQQDQRVVTRLMLARVLCLQGFVDQASHVAEASLKEAQTTNQILTLRYVLGWAVCPISLMTGNLAAAERSVAMMIDLAKLHLPFWETVGLSLKGTLLIRRGEFAMGLDLLRTAVDKIRYPHLLGVLAEGLAGLGRFTEALAAVEQALSTADRSGERWYLSELLRIKGELLLQAAGPQPAVSAAEDCFHRALEIARQQGALFWELRGALSLARFRVTQDRRDDARQILAPVYDRFTEGFETADLRAARAMLQSLPSRPAEFARCDNSA
jgi:predicted ATPase/DNA-binding winged helix-turn-helix (wHTH) protein